MHVFSAFIWPFHCMHIPLTKAHAACRRPKSFVRRCTSETILTSADAACRRPVSFLRMMHHCIMAPRFQPKERKATEDWLTALKCQPVGTDGTIKGSPSPALASQHQNFISGTEPICFFSYGKELFFSNAFFVPMATRSGILYCQAQYHSGKFCAKPY